MRRSESELLDVINEGFAETFWQRFGQLREKLEQETLSDQERQEFLALNAQVEAKLGADASIASAPTRFHPVRFLSNTSTPALSEGRTPPLILSGHAWAATATKRWRSLRRTP